MIKLKLLFLAICFTTVFCILALLTMNIDDGSQGLSLPMIPSLMFFGPGLVYHKLLPDFDMTLPQLFCMAFLHWIGIFFAFLMSMRKLIGKLGADRLKEAFENDNEIK